LQSLSVSLHGSYAPTNGASPMDLAASAAPFVMNGIEQSAEIGVPLLGRAADGWFLELRGRNGDDASGSPREAAIARAMSPSPPSPRLDHPNAIGWVQC
jgi:hypothetical protein